MRGAWGRRLVAASVLTSGAVLGVRGAESQPPPTSTTLRLHGLVEPVRSFVVAAPRLAAGQPGPGSQLVVIRLASSGQVVKKGDLLVEFDRHAQLKAARDRESEYQDLLQQIRKKKAEQRVAKAKRDTELLQARNALRVAELDMLGAELLPAIQAEKNEQALEEARAHLGALQKTQTLKDHVDSADVRALEIQRDRALNAWRNAEANAQRMQVVAPIDGLVVLKSIWKNGTMAVVQEGEEVRAGIPILDVVDTSAMRVRALVNQADVERLTVGQTARVTLDSYPARTFDARLEHLSPVATTSMMNTRVRSFLALFTISGSDAHLLPDLGAAIDIITSEAHVAASP